MLIGIKIMFEARCGTILQLGDMDFYPDGGSVQSGCWYGADATWSSV